MGLHVRISDPEVAALTLYAPLPWFLRLDVLPFTLLYATALYLYLLRATGDVLAVLLAAITMFFHALAFLAGEWSVDISAWVGYVPVRGLQSERLHDAQVHVKVVPARTTMAKEICRVHVTAAPSTTSPCTEATALQAHSSEKHEVPVLRFAYQNISFCMYDDLKALNAGTARFRRLDFPTQLPLDAYLRARGHGGDGQSDSLARAQLKWGHNDFALHVPRFSVLLKEQLVAPFFVFQFFCMLLWCLDEYVYYSLLTLAMLVVFECTVVLQRQRNMETLQAMRRAPQQLFVYRKKRWIEIWSDALVPGDICSIGQKLPGPLTEQDPLRTVPCDMLLLRGSAVVNEAMLSGESVPLRKEPLVGIARANDSVLSVDEGTDQAHKKHVLFGGTKVLQHSVQAMESTSRAKANPSPEMIPLAPDRGCLAFVLRTGFGTTQGSLMRTILHASQRVTANNGEAMAFILLLLVFAVAAAGFVLQHGLQDPTRNRFKLVLHCVMIVTSVVPPELPMELSLAVTNSLLALMRVSIYCTEPFRIPLAGRIDVCCFDKTGTLTSDELRMRGIAGLTNEAPASSATESKTQDPADSLQHAHEVSLDSALVLAGCHSLVFLHGQVRGDPLEVTALRSVRWQLSFGRQWASGDHESTIVEPALVSRHRGDVQRVRILHRFAFSSALKRMSTVVAVELGDNDTAEDVRVLCKGAPEVLEPLLKQKPTHYAATYQHFAAKGCRVLALAYRRLEGQDSEGVKAQLLEPTASDREEMESELVFAGFLVMDCPLKPDTTRTIRDLVRAQHRVIMVTGDNALTACDVARQTGILRSESQRNDGEQITRKELLVLHAGEKSAGPCTKSDMEKRALLATSVSWRRVEIGSDADEAELAFGTTHIPRLGEQFNLCVTGEALAVLLREEEERAVVDCDNLPQKPHSEMSPITPTTATSIRQQSAFEAYLRVLAPLSAHVSVFARTSPIQKEHLLMALNRAGKTTAMCGDGTNDVGALKRAHVGISIVNSTEPASHRPQGPPVKSNRNGSSAGSPDRYDWDAEDGSGLVQLGDASIASPFTSKRGSIDVVRQLVRQGRCTLVTTIQMYKILGVNCLITAYYLSSLFVLGVKNGDQQLTIVGLGLALFFFFLSRAKPARALSASRPPTGVFCVPVMTSILVQSLIHLGFLVAALQVATPFIDPHDPAMHPDGKFAPNVINSIMYIMSAVMQVTTFVANYRGQPFMESLWAHKALSRGALVSYFVLVVAVLEVVPGLNGLFELVSMPNEQVRWTVLGLMVGDTVSVLTLETIIQKMAD